jgi:hypothetical protein
MWATTRIGIVCWSDLFLEVTEATNCFSDADGIMKEFFIKNARIH